MDDPIGSGPGAGVGVVPHATTMATTAKGRNRQAMRRVMVGDMAKVDPELAAKNRGTVTRLAYRPRFYNPDLGKWLHRIDVPTLLLWGAADGLVPPKFGEAYRALIPGSRLVVLPNAGHAPFDEQNDAFLAAFHDFIGG